MKYCALGIPLIIYSQLNKIFNWKFKQIEIEFDQKLKKKSNMTDILMTKIYNTFETYLQNIRPFLSGVLNHVHGIGHLDKTTLTGLLEQASDHTTAFQQNVLANYFTLLNLFPSTLDNTKDMNCT